jgi:large conductance mechanosensitive channel
VASKAASLWEDFKDFLMKGNLVTVAVAFVMALVFAAVVKSLIVDIITPIIALIFGQPNFENLSFTINSSHFLYGDFINVVITFLATAAALFFFVVKPYEYYKRHKDPTVKDCPECTSEIPIGAKRCPECTAVLVP